MPKTTIRRAAALSAAAAFLPVSLALGASPASASVGSSIAATAQANLGDMACSTNSAGGKGYYSSCTGGPEAWCADFAKWVWAQNGVDVNGLTPAAGSFGRYNGGLHSTPHVGDAILFNYNGAGYADHVAVVTAVGNGTVTTIGGNEHGVSGNWSATSIVQQSTHSSAVGYSWGGQRISGYVSPIGGNDAGSGGTPAPTPASPNHVYDNIRFANATWQGAALADGGADVSQVANASLPNGDTHVLTLVGGSVYDNVRFANGTWQGAAVADGGGHIDQIAAVGMPNGDMHLETLSGGVVYDNIRFANGTWQGAKVADGGGSVGAISVAALPNGDMHLVTLTSGSVYDNVRHADGSWQGAQVFDNGGYVSSVAAVGMPNGDMHVETLNSGSVYDNVHFANGTWQGAKVADGGGSVGAISVAALPNGDM
ncbi:CHAP domain-containing protein, partial [Kitasatospora sp. NPDC059648]|uniref:CHAP domain-containing protein n=1 Tax=Kitasatospora sp. NPDC059648 TaxID=3346894 RepID=UPI0036BBC412